MTDTPTDIADDHRVHGLADDRIVPDWPPLTATEIDMVLNAYPALDTPRSLAWHSPRPLSAAALVDTAGGRVFVKRHHRRVRTVATLTEEHRFAGHLRGRGIPVPEVLADARGATAIARGEWVYEVHAPAAGGDRFRDAVSWEPVRDLGVARSAGAALARLHVAARGYAAPQRDTHVLVTRCDLIAAAEPAQALAAQLPHRPGLATYLAERDWRTDLATVVGPDHASVCARLSDQPRLWTHNDWHVSNLFWSGDTVAAVLDFGLASPTCAAFDLATAIERNAIAWLKLDDRDEVGHIDIAAALIAGYRSEAGLDADALRLVADLLPVVHVDFALSEVEYFHAVTGHDDHADVAYDTFLLGHTAWFRTTPGRAFLHALRAMA